MWWACRPRFYSVPRWPVEDHRHRLLDSFIGAAHDPRLDRQVARSRSRPPSGSALSCSMLASTTGPSTSWSKPAPSIRTLRLRVYPGFPTIFSGLLGFFVGDFMGKALWQLVENAQRFPRRGGRVLCVHGAVSFHGARPWATRWLPGRGARRDVELDRCVLGLRSGRCSHQNRRPVQAERSIYPGKTEISGTYALWETRI